jgi:hypothetical protein
MESRSKLMPKIQLEARTQQHAADVISPNHYLRMVLGIHELDS